MQVRRSGRVAILAAFLAATVVAPSSATAKSDPAPREVAFTAWSGPEFAVGTHDGTVVDVDGLGFGGASGSRDYADPFGDGSTRSYDYARWTSPEVEPGFELTELVASWNAKTPGGSWVEIEMRGTADDGSTSKWDDGSTSKWYVMGRWAETDAHLHRTSLSGQGDDLGFVAIDTFVASEGRSMSSWQLRVTLLRPEGSDTTPGVRSAGAMASALPEVKKVKEASPSGGAEGIVLDVPTYSQETHIGHYPQWDGGGEA